MLGPMHTILSGLKAFWTTNSYEGIKTIRECCGAAGFSSYSAIPGLIEIISSYVTLEGDSVVMYLQTARSLLKAGRKVFTEGKSTNKMMEYIADLKLLQADKPALTLSENSKSNFLNEKVLLDLLKFNALLRIGKCLQLFADP